MPERTTTPMMQQRLQPPSAVGTMRMTLHIFSESGTVGVMAIVPPAARWRALLPVLCAVPRWI